jgi:protein-tyrosine-phosphatase
MFKILFICTDNVGRSVTAEYLLLDMLAKAGRHDIEVVSAGTTADSDVSSFCFAHLDKLYEMGIDTSGHERTQVTKEILENCDLAIVMEGEHREWIEERFDTKVYFYNEIYKDEKTDIQISPLGSQGTMEEKCLRMVEYFEESLPTVLEKIDEMIHSADSGSSPE